MNIAALPPMETLRRDLLDKVDEYCELTGMAQSSVGKAIAEDWGLIIRLRGGANLTFSSYERIRLWLERNWPKTKK